MKGSPPRRRAVATVMPWAAGGLAQCLEVVRPCYGTGSHPAVWLTERGGRISVRQIDDRFAQLRGLAGPNRRADSRKELPCTAAEAVAAAGMGSPRLERPPAPPLGAHQTKRPGRPEAGPGPPAGRNPRPGRAETRGPR
ncbi:MAG TPA: hypothetical protein VF933_19100 [Streptosporangiaceae bacterium]